MDLVGRRVQHSKYGAGEIESFDGKYIQIKFGSQKELKTFCYPHCVGSMVFLDIDTETEETMLQEKGQHEKEVIVERRREERKKKAQTRDAFLEMLSATYDKQFETIDDFCCEYSDALEAEIAHIQNEKGRIYSATDGIPINRTIGRYYYAFELDSEITLLDGMDITLRCNNKNFSASVVSCADYKLVIETDEDLGSDLSCITFTSDFWRLLDHLKKRLMDIQLAPSKIVTRLACNCLQALDNAGEMKMGRDAAIEMASSLPVLFIWGPPGTGKTESLTDIALDHLAKGNRVLMLSHTNVAVDDAIWRTYQKAKQRMRGDIVRYGYPRKEKILSDNYQLSSYNLALNNCPELRDKRNGLLVELESFPRESKKGIDILKALAQIREQLRAEEKRIARRARFLATTVSKAVMDPCIHTQQFDVVIFDEASMAYVPQIVFAAGLASKHFVCIGDFCQLPPIVQSEEAKLLKKDIFEYCCVSRAVKERMIHKWMCLLDTQHRMHSSIANIVNQHMYQGLLKTAETVDDARYNIQMTAPMQGRTIGLVDLSGYMSVCSKARDFSHFNILSAFVTFGLASSAELEVGIITPYKAQARLIRAMIRDAQISHDKKTLTCATVHQFQGSQKDIIIFDTVDCYRQGSPGMLLGSDRLINVAITRAKGKFIVVANADYMTKMKSTTLLGKALSSFCPKEEVLKGTEVIAQCSPETASLLHFYSDGQANSDFLTDIENAGQEIIIDIPDSMNASNEFVSALSKVLSAAKERGVDVYVRAENIAKLPIELRRFSTEHVYAYDPVAIIDKNTVWFGAPNSGANFITANGIIETQHRLIFKFEGEYTAKALRSLLNISNRARRVF